MQIVWNRNLDAQLLTNLFVSLKLLRSGGVVKAQMRQSISVGSEDT